MYIFAAEFLAFITSVIIFSFTYKRGIRMSSLRRHFLACVVMNMIAILLNYLTLQTDLYISLFSRRAGYLINSLYFFSCFSCITLYISYLLRKLLVHIQVSQLYHRFWIFAVILLCALTLLLIINVPTGLLFYFDSENTYQQGPLWLIGYIQLIIMLAVLLFFTLRYHTVIDREGKRLIQIGLPIIALFFVFQILYPGVLLNGTMGAFTAVLCFLSFESHTEDIDPITKLENLRSFSMDLNALKESSRPYHIILVTLRNFADVNSTLGYNRGSELLYQIAHEISCLFPTGKVYRFGSTSFSILLPMKDRKSALADLHSLMDLFSESGENFGTRYSFSPSFLHLIQDTENLSADGILNQLEYAKCIARKEDLYLLSFDDTLREKLNRRKYIVSYLQDALQEQKFEMWYQPIYCVKEQKFLTAEALIRLRDSDGSYISPEEFISISEDCQLITIISEQTFETVVRFLHDHAELPVRISYNLSARQLQSPSHMKKLFSLLEQYEISHQKIAFELTERLLFSKERSVQSTLSRMQRAKAEFLLDDFGTGYSNFAAVLDFPFSKIKLDKSLLKRNNTDSYSMIEMLIRMFHESGKEIVVEGVETREEADLLIRYGADYLQGYYFAKPMPEKEFIAFLSAEERHMPFPGN